jgi:ABC-type uncharacterized transport system substrate-binding protein
MITLLRLRPWYNCFDMTSVLRFVCAALFAFGLAAPAAAHPHVWVTATSDLIFAADGSVTGVRQHWTFDDMFSAFAVQGLQSKEKGKFTRAELAPVAKVNLDSLKESAYFTYASAGGKKVPFGAPLPDYWLDYKDAILTLNFTLPFKQPVKAKDLKVEIYDPTYFIDFVLAKETPVHLVGAPAQCKLAVEWPREMTYAMGKKLSDNPEAATDWGAFFANKIMVKCP